MSASQQHCELNHILDMGDNSTLAVVYSLRYFGLRYSYYHGYICAFLCTYGIIANVINIIVLTRPWMRTAVNIILSAIAICDIGTMVSYFVYVLHVRLIHSDFPCHSDVYTYSWLLYILFHSLWSIFLHTTSLWLAVLLAFIRLCVIRRAKIATTVMTPVFIGRLIFAVCFGITVFMIPISLVNSVKTTDPRNRCAHEVNQTLYTIDLSEMGMQNNCLLLRVALWISGILFKLLPCVFLTVLIWGLLRTYKEARQRNKRFRRQSAQNQPAPYTYTMDQKCRGSETAPLTLGVPIVPDRRESTLLQHRATLTAVGSVPVSRATSMCQAPAFTSRTTIMLTSILLIFLLTEIPQALLAGLGGFFPDVYFTIYPSVGEVLDLLSLINSSVNFILYCSMSSRFRATFVYIFWTRFWLKETSRSQGSQSLHDGLGMNLAVGILATPKFKRYVLWRRKHSMYHQQSTQLTVLNGVSRQRLL
uniref:G-protein coupled receptors family 1 profile domain-containing protein n=1 Tax=Plectus sambesii TaxID=2011161 RepID=A0A914WCM6_9BILA